MLAPGSDSLPQAGKIEFAKYGVLTPLCSEVKDWAAQDLTGEEELMAEAVVKFYRDKVAYCGYREKGLERVKDFSLHKITKQWVELIER